MYFNVQTINIVDHTNSNTMEAKYYFIQRSLISTNGFYKKTNEIKLKQIYIMPSKNYQRSEFTIKRILTKC